MIDFGSFDPTVWLVAIGLLFLAVVMALIRVIKGPTAPDRIVGLDTINTMVIVGMIIFSVYTRSIIYIDVAIVYAFLSFITTLFVAKYLEGGEF